MRTETWIFIFYETFASFVIGIHHICLSVMQQIDRDKLHKYDIFTSSDSFVFILHEGQINIILQ